MKREWIELCSWKEFIRNVNNNMDKTGTWMNQCSWIKLTMHIQFVIWGGMNPMDENEF